MSAYNWVNASATCPVCGKTAVVRAQTHVASSYDGDQTGRFFDRTYALGSEMAWWPLEDVRYETWAERGDSNWRPLVREACYSACSLCGAELCAVIEFENLRPMRLTSVSRKDEWPVGYHA